MTETVSREIVELAELQDDWRNKLITTDKGAPLGILANAITALRHAPEWQGVLAFNEFNIRTEIVAAPPWAGNRWSPRAWGDVDDTRTADWIQHKGIRVTVDVVSKAVETVAHDRGFHPVKDYLGGLAWDGKPRSFASSYLGAEETVFSNAVGSRFLIGAVARIDGPGAKVDHVPILEGPQGTLKSTALRTLAEPWFADEIAELGSKDASMATAGVWVIEISELDSMSRAEISKVKAFLSRGVDRFRPPYGRRLIDNPRQCVFAGTTNSDAYLKDETGGRRFWPIKCGRIDIDALARDRDQLWAEARELYRAGQPWWLDSPELIAAATEEQGARYQTDPWTEKVIEHLGARTETSIVELLRDAIGVPHERWSRSDEMRVAAILKRDGWRRYQQVHHGVRRWRYRKSDAPTS